MKKTTILLLMIAVIGGCRKEQKEETENNNYKNIGTIMERNYEKFDFEAAKRYATSSKTTVEIKMGDTIRVMHLSEKYLCYVDYLPSIDLYTVVKYFYPNGAIKSKANWLGFVRFGTYEEYDENGNCIKKVNEDKKFGGIRRENIVRFLEKEGWFNRKTGENKVAEESPLKTDGSFYREIIRYIDISFVEARYDQYGKEIEPPEWSIVINSYSSVHVTEYKINGNTGECKVREYDDFKTD